ncbi:MAG: FAD-dependent protein, partial [Polyangia bacterium]
DDAVVQLLTDGGRIRGVRCASGREVQADAVVLAPGHSARPLYAALHQQKVALVPKGFAIGARIEHPQPLIDRIQYGAAAGHEGLPASFYQLSTQVQPGRAERGVYSFCMCPGGWVVPSSTEEGLLCTNGMSLSRRDSPLANAAMVVNIEPADWRTEFGDGPLGGIELQRALERRAFAAGGGGYVAAAQRLEDFWAKRPSTILSRTITRSTYRPGVIPGDVRASLPAFVAEALALGLRKFGKMLPGFGDGEAHLVGVETRSSAPVRILRDDSTLASPSHEGLYPTGEGAGYAGGIVSAAIDGLRVARAIGQRHA